jgi:hypothetical protein
MQAARWFAHLTSRKLSSTMAEPLVPLPTVEKLSNRVIRILGGNPSKVSASLCLRDTGAD